jgi:hypothetical protein
MGGACLGVFLLLKNKSLYGPIPLHLISDSLQLDRLNIPSGFLPNLRPE